MQVEKDSFTQDLFKCFSGHVLETRWLASYEANRNMDVWTDLYLDPSVLMDVEIASIILGKKKCFWDFYLTTLSALRLDDPTEQTVQTERLLCSVSVDVLLKIVYNLHCLSSSRFVSPYYLHPI